MWDERDLIATHFTPLARDGEAALGLRDDTAILTAPADGDLALTVDTITCGVHYLPDDPGYEVARKLVRVNLSDLAAMGARPIGYLLGSAFARELDTAWIGQFVEGLARDQRAYNLALLGGDTTATPGPSSLTLTAVGSVPREAALRRSGARPHDIVYVSGTIGDAALGLRLLRGDLAHASADDAAVLVQRYRRPEPRVGLGRSLRERGLATAAVDVSDGLVADLEHIAAASGLGVTLDGWRVPISSPARRLQESAGVALDDLLTGGDDYELAFTAPARLADDVLAAAADADVAVAPIGRAVAGEGVHLRDAAGRTRDLTSTGWRHG